MKNEYIFSEKETSLEIEVLKSVLYLVDKVKLSSASLISLFGVTAISFRTKLNNSFQCIAIFKSHLSQYLLQALGSHPRQVLPSSSR